MTMPNEIQRDRFSRVRQATLESAVPHQTFVRCLEKLSRFHQRSLSESKYRCAFVTGETGAGKSTLIEYYASQYPREARLNVDFAPIVCVRAPGRSTVKGLGNAILIKLGGPSQMSWSDFEITNQVVKLIRAMDVQLLIIDEVQDLLEWKRNSSLFPTLVANFVQAIIDATAAGVVLVGLPNIEDIADQERQLASRTGAYIRMAGLRPTNPAERADFKLLMKAIENNSLLPFYAPLETPLVALRIQMASAGYIGEARRLVRFAINNAEDEGSALVRLQDFSAALRDTTPGSTLRVDPFKMSDADLIAWIEADPKKAMKDAGPRWTE
ncbi:TniB family NTP-binding protein [Parvibaculum sp.]|uniref:TniB family NTP-binding protein n=1 Tax=Parvibaculum sp. TaxID=2024848 RepID=UPI0026066B4D|nr:TniB family NTP-binding protein [Parvibaculum sp.]MCW5728530.1 TniB family NTP-binding protein [Parvibaculum sp.]